MGIFTKKEKKQIRKSTLRLETLEDRMLLAISAGGEAAAAEIVAAPEATEAAAEIVLTDTSSASLRTALKNIAAGGTITYDASLEGETVDVNDKGYGTVQITKNVTIIGNGVNFTNSNTNGKGQIFRIGAKQVEAGTTAVTFRDMVFTGGSATGYNSETDGISNSGAAIYCVYPGVTSATPSSTGPTITIDSCEFYDNTCGTIMASYCYGGAVYLYGADGVITNCTFSGNSSAIYGGALHVMASNLTMDNCNFTNNSALCGGAVSVWAGFNVTISDCNFTENAALSYEDGFSEYAELNKKYGVNEYESVAARGGAFFIVNTSDSSKGSVTLNNCTISENIATAPGEDHLGDRGYGCLAARGGGLYISESAVNLNYCEITGNKAFNAKETHGGGIYNTGDYEWETHPSVAWGAVRVVGCTIAENTVGSLTDIWWKKLGYCGCQANGGGIYSYGPLVLVDTAVVNNIIYGTTATNDGLKGSGIYANTSLNMNALGHSSWNFIWCFYSTIAGNQCITAYENQGIGDYSAGLWDWGKGTYVGCAILDNTATVTSTGKIHYYDVYSFAHSGNPSCVPSIFQSCAINTNTIYTLNKEITYKGNIQVTNVKAFFNDPDNGDYSLAANSTGIDAVDMTATTASHTYSGTTLSMDVNDYIFPYDCRGEGYDRLVNNIYDIGAYEVQGKAPTPTKLDTPVIKTGAKGVYVSYGANRHQLTWGAVTGAESYEVSYSADGKSWKTVTSSSTSAVIKGLTYGTDVQYKVRAVAGTSTSDWSSVKTFNVCPMDINGDGDIAGADRSLLSSAWLSSEGDDEFIAACDINADGDVAGADRNFLSSNWLCEAGDEDLVYPKAKAADAAVAEFVSEFDIDLEVF